ncbi:MAG: ABC transporter permease [Chloroflexi bacterium]|nr:ABC transporter permease [Chloroflexota bacterium]
MKKWFDPLSSAWMGIISHKLRSSLTILGVVIGVGAVISLMSVGRGAEASIISNVQNLGANLLFVRPGFTSEGGVRGGFGSAQTLTLEDATAIGQQIPEVAIVAPFFSSNMQVVAGGQNLRSQITGMTPDYQWAYNLQAAQGDLISDYDYQSSMKVAVLGPNVSNTLFAGEDPTGQTIRMGNSIVRVIGVLQAKGNSMLGSTDDAILVPMTALKTMVAQPRTSRNETVVSSIAVLASDQRQVSSITEQITSLLRDRHQIAFGADSDFSITSVQDIANTLSSAMGTMTILLGAIAAISLLVGGIGVMNIMLVSVIERTREIGIRKALGAKERDIWGQFLIEAAFLTFTGGVIGIALGWSSSFLIERFASMATLVSPDIIALAISVSVGIGLFFGFYPAWQASHLDPIEALRAE